MLKLPSLPGNASYKASFVTPALPFISRILLLKLSFFEFDLAVEFTIGGRRIVLFDILSAQWSGA